MSALAQFAPMVAAIVAILAIVVQFGYGKATMDRLVEDRDDDQSDLKDWQKSVSKDLEELKIHKERSKDSENDLREFKDWQKVVSRELEDIRISVARLNGRGGGH